MSDYLPEGQLISKAENKNCMRSVYALQECMASQKIIEAPCLVCDNSHNLIVDLGCIKGVIPRIEGAIGIDTGMTRDIALISRVNKAVAFKITGFSTDETGKEIALLSRRLAQEECVKNYVSKLQSGDVIPAKVTHLEQFGCFVDIGCGIPSLIPIDSISVSRISHPSDRFFVGQDIFAVVKSNEDNRICLSHKELLGTWQENSEAFRTGETVAGIVRSIENYGIFVELAPNLAGLAELRDGIEVNQYTSVYIKAIIPDKMKIKLIIVDTFDSGYINKNLDYFITEGKIENWIYSTPNSGKIIESLF